jgi:signal peptidase I
MATMAKSTGKYHWTDHLIRWQVRIILAYFLIVLTFLAYGTLPNRWYHVLYVYSGSMVPSIYPGDLIVITPPPKFFKLGTVLTLNVNGQLVTHRLVRINPDGSLVTKGDNNPVEDDWGNIPVKIVGLHRFSIPYLGYISQLSPLFHPSATGSWFNATDSLDFSVWTGDASPTIGTSLSAEASAIGFYDDGLKEYGTDGEICVTNQGDVATIDLRISGLVEYKNKDSSGYQPLAGTDFELSTPGTLIPDENRCYSYRTTFNPIEGANYRIAATVSITNHSGWMPGGPHCAGTASCPFGPAVRTEFTIPVDPSMQIGTTVPTPTPTSTFISTRTPTKTLYPTITPTPTNTTTLLLPTFTNTPFLPTFTNTPLSPTNTLVPTFTATKTLYPTAIRTPTCTNTPVPPTNTPEPTSTPLPTETTP